MEHRMVRQYTHIYWRRRQDAAAYAAHPTDARLSATGAGAGQLPGGAAGDRPDDVALVGWHSWHECGDSHRAAILAQHADRKRDSAWSRHRDGTVFPYLCPSRRFWRNLAPGDLHAALSFSTVTHRRQGGIRTCGI